MLIVSHISYFHYCSVDCVSHFVFFQIPHTSRFTTTVVLIVSHISYFPRFAVHHVSRLQPSLCDEGTELDYCSVDCVSHFVFFQIPHTSRFTTTVVLIVSHISYFPRFAVHHVSRLQPAVRDEGTELDYCSVDCVSHFVYSLL